jgi:hypothetical protein
MKSIFSRLVTLSIILLLGTSCMTHRHTVGEGPVGTKGKTEVHSRAKQGYIFWGLVPLGRPHPVAPSHGNYQIKTGSNVGDAILGTITLGLVTFRTVRIIVYKEDKVFDEGYEKGGKVSFQKGKDSFVGEVMEIDNEKGKVSFQYTNIYGETKTDEKKVSDVATLTDEQYSKRLEAWNTEIAKYKYNPGEFATWTQGKDTKFGKITSLNDKAHKASIEYIDVYGETKLKEVPFLDVTIIETSEHETKLEAWNVEVAKYKFAVGEKVSWSGKDSEMVPGEVVSLDDKTHQAEVKFMNDKEEEKLVKKGYLKLVKG